MSSKDNSIRGKKVVTIHPIKDASIR